MPRYVRALAVCLCLSAAGLIGRAQAEAQAQGQTPGAPCNLVRAAEIPARMDGGYLLIKIQVEGRDAWMKISAREPHSLISRQLADQLKLHPHAVQGVVIRDDAMPAIKHMVEINTLAFGNIKAAKTSFLVQDEDAALPMPWEGTIGVDLLANYDVEFDPAHGKINLFLPNRCNGQAGYWSRNVTAVPFKLSMSQPIFQMTLADQPVTATLDTGAADTTLLPDVAKSRFNIDPEATGVATDGEKITNTGAILPFYRHRFASLDIGGVAFRNTEIGIVSGRALRRQADQGQFNIDAILHPVGYPQASLKVGMHHLIRLRFMIAFGEGTLYVSAADAN